MAQTIVPASLKPGDDLILITATRLLCTYGERCAARTDGQDRLRGRAMPIEACPAARQERGICSICCAWGISLAFRYRKDSVMNMNSQVARPTPTLLFTAVLVMKPLRIKFLHDYCITTIQAMWAFTMADQIHRLPRPAMLLHTHKVG
ncbi:hypothetical protein T440DRAFT_156263 [Plenodomus tracheiphilus IPT5]|uniref:Uncharacterized protein n=1 Tax=Plenodomus tracheiphilus IPT5 TaxID=1408161 RepID=A0A6A7BM38_9PLEO|nr:hypothetical protein T440DRAFT_156263 [Plenodomus tracheiphilus IPT5]